MQREFKWLDFKVTNRCNNRCTYCGVSQDSISAPESIPLDCVKNTITDAIKVGFTNFAFLGGEPSIRNDIHLIFDPFQTDTPVDTVLVITNMHQFNDRMYHSVFRTNADNAFIVASVDTTNRHNHKNQNPNSVLDAINRIQKIADKYTALGTRGVHVHTVISRENLEDIKSHVANFHEMGIEVSMALVEPFSIVDTPRLYNEFTIDEMKTLVQNLNQLELSDLLAYSNQVLREYIDCYILETNEMSGFCTAGSQHVIIDSDGSVYPCLTESYARGLSYGNIKTTAFRSIYSDIQDFQCTSKFAQTCWDHFLWTQLGNQLGGE